MTTSCSSVSAMAARSARGCSCNTVTALICMFNVILIFYVLQTLLLPANIDIKSANKLSLSLKMFRQYYIQYPSQMTEEDVRKVSESQEARLRLYPSDLVKRVYEIQKESADKYGTVVPTDELREDLILSLSRKLDLLKAGFGNKTINRLHIQRGLEGWRKAKLQEIQKLGKRGKTQSAQTKAMETMVVAGWASLLADIGWNYQEIPSDQEIDTDIIPGRPLPPECRAEPHTDYDGKAVRWGLTFHVDSAADCCQACLDHAKTAKPGQLKCNIWVYCPDEGGCYSSDKYEHHYKECWLKQDGKPRLNFKRTYSPAYRKFYPKAPIVVPWASGVIS